ncbi:MAG TPA: Hpt domain-containing protein [Flavobacteriales bacterium]|nr:Hpt domain-containing protein [Flavobacteriales bacterium]
MWYLIHWIAPSESTSVHFTAMGSPIDLSYLERLFKGDRKRVHAWITIYLEESPAQFQELTDAVGRNDPQALSRVAHELRPQAHYLGTPRMLELLVVVAEVARTGETGACRDAVAELVAMGQAVDAELRAVLMT